jgi:hypothetical protein
MLNQEDKELEEVKAEWCMGWLGWRSSSGGDYDGDGVASGGHESGRRNTKKRMEAATACHGDLELPLA